MKVLIDTNVIMDVLNVWLRRRPNSPLCRQMWHGLHHNSQHKGLWHVTLAAILPEDFLAHNLNKE